jgi:cephalosporin hydroxylase
MTMKTLRRYLERHYGQRLQKTLRSLGYEIRRYYNPYGFTNGHISDNQLRLASGYREFWKAAHEHYPDQMTPGGLLDQTMFEAVRNVVNAEHIDRLAKPSSRGWISSIYPWSFPISRSSTRGALALTYKGLMNLKTPFDLALYTRLIWELQPRAIFEFGSFQGGSGLWLADQMSILCEERGEVHSFDLHIKCVSPTAKHPLLKFHQVDLKDLGALDAHLKRAPHPWLVIDDAHVEVFSLFVHVSQFMKTGDYYVIEDAPMLANMEIMDGLREAEKRGFLIDTYYTDAFGTNLTSAPNAWLRKS